MRGSLCSFAETTLHGEWLELLVLLEDGLEVAHSFQKNQDFVAY